MAFTVIGTVDDGAPLPPTAFESYVTPASEYVPMLRKTGFIEVVDTDVTDAFHVTAQRWLEAASDLEGDLREVLGDEGYRDKVNSRTETFDAIESGAVRRLLITATAYRGASGQDDHGA